MALALPHAMRCVAAAAPSVLKRICRMGIIAMKENMLSTADSMLNNTVSTRYFLYGGTNRLSTLINSFM